MLREAEDNAHGLSSPDAPVQMFITISVQNVLLTYEVICHQRYKLCTFDVRRLGGLLQMSICFYTVRCYAQRGIAAANCFPVCPSVRNVEVSYRDHIGRIFENNFTAWSVRFLQTPTSRFYSKENTFVCCTM